MLPTNTAGEGVWLGLGKLKTCPHESERELNHESGQKLNHESGQKLNHESGQKLSHESE